MQSDFFASMTYHGNTLLVNVEEMPTESGEMSN